MDARWSASCNNAVVVKHATCVVDKRVRHLPRTAAHGCGGRGTSLSCGTCSIAARKPLHVADTLAACPAPSAMADGRWLTPAATSLHTYQLSQQTLPDSLTPNAKTAILARRWREVRLTPHPALPRLAAPLSRCAAPHHPPTAGAHRALVPHSRQYSYIGSRPFSPHAPMCAMDARCTLRPAPPQGTYIHMLMDYDHT